MTVLLVNGPNLERQPIDRLHAVRDEGIIATSSPCTLPRPS